MQNPFLVLGASGAIGSAIAKAASVKGYKTLLHYHKNESGVKELATELDAKTYAGDLTTEEGVTSFVEGIEKEWGTLGGVAYSVALPFPQKLTYKTSWEVFQTQLDTQLKAFHFSMQKLFPLLKKFEGEARVLVVSTEYMLGLPPIKIAPYLAAKAAQTKYAQVIAQEWLKHGIRVQIIAPGLVRSNLTADMPELYLEQMMERMPEKKLTSLEDIQGVSEYLLSPAADSLYGTIVPATRGERRC